MSNRPLPINIEFVKGLFSLDPSLPSGLKWISGRRNGKMAGSINNEGYWQVRIGTSRKSNLLKAHRIVWAISNLQDPCDMVIDHIDRNKSNNDIKNLRVLNKSQNSWNCKRMDNVKGYSLRPNGKFQVRVRVNFRDKHIGVFDNIEDARAAYLTNSPRFNNNS